MGRGKGGGKKTPSVSGGLVVTRPSEQEPELTDEERELIWQYSGAHLANWHQRVLDNMPGRDVHRLETPVAELEYRNSSICDAYVRLTSLLDERSKGRFRAYMTGIIDRPPGLKGWIAGGGIGLVALLVAGPFVAVPAAATVTVADSLRKTRKLLEPATYTGFPDLPEFKNDWAVQSYRFVRQVRGFHVRVATVERLRRFRLMPKTAEWYAKLLFGARARLEKNMGTLFSLQPDFYRVARKRSVRSEDVLASDEQNRLLRQMLPTWDPDLDWLPLEDGLVQPGVEFDRLRDDLMLLDSLHEAAKEARRDERDEEWAEAIRKAEAQAESEEGGEESED